MDYDSEFEPWGIQLQAALHQSQYLLRELKNQNIMYGTLKSHAASTIAWRSGEGVDSSSHGCSHATTPSKKMESQSHENEFSSLSRIITTPRDAIEPKASPNQARTPIYIPGYVRQEPSYAIPSESTTVATRRKLFRQDEQEALPQSTLEIREMIKRLRQARRAREAKGESQHSDHTVERFAVKTPQLSSSLSKNSIFPSSESTPKYADASIQVSIFEFEDSHGGVSAAPRQLALVASLAAATAFGLSQAAHKMIYNDRDHTGTLIKGCL